MKEPIHLYPLLMFFSAWTAGLICKKWWHYIGL